MKKELERWEKLGENLNNIKELYTLAIDEEDHSLEKEINESLLDIEEKYRLAEILALLDVKYDEASTFLNIHSGAGGTEACDWVSMLLRMYLRWAEKHGYKTEIIDILEVEGGIKSVMV